MTKKVTLTKAIHNPKNWMTLRTALKKAVKNPDAGFFATLRVIADLSQIQAEAHKEFAAGYITGREASDKWSEALFRYNASQTYREKIRGKRGI